MLGDLVTDREIAHLSQKQHWIAADDGETQRRHLDADAGSPLPIHATEKVQGQVEEEVLEGAAEVEIAGVGVEGGAGRLREFPVMVLPPNAEVGPKRGSGVLPFGYDLRSVPKSECMLLLTLQVGNERRVCW